MKRRANIFIWLLIAVCLTGLFSCSEAPYEPYQDWPWEDEIGDINLDGVAYSIADAVMLADYMVYGETALIYIDDYDQYGIPVGYRRSIRTSDVNGDGITLGVADLVSLVRTIVGYRPNQDIHPVAVNVIFGTTLSADIELGAARVVLIGEQHPINLTDGMELTSRFDGINTHVLIWSYMGETFDGEFLGNVGDVIEAELATAEGNPVVDRIIPADYNLGQNYPNPFTATTSISYVLPVETDYTLQIRDVHGETIESYDLHDEAGFYTFEWDPKQNPPGVYLAKLIAGDFEQTIKMLYY